MTRKELFYSVLNQHKRIEYLFKTQNPSLYNFLINNTKDWVHDYLDKEITLETNEDSIFQTKELHKIILSIKNELFNNNTFLARHVFDFHKCGYHGKIDFKSTWGEDLIWINASFYLRTKWPNFFYKNETLYIPCQLICQLICQMSEDFSIYSAKVIFYDLNDLHFEIYPYNEINIKEMKKNTPRNIESINKTNKRSWNITT